MARQGKLMEPRRLLRLLRFTASWALVLLLGCAHVPRQTAAIRTAELDASTVELRTRAVELGRQAIREVELAADSIDVLNPQKVAVRRNTLLWRMSTVSEAAEAVLRENPVHAMIDLYAFRLQMEGFLASPAGHASFGADAAVGQRAMARLAKRWEGVAAQVGAQFADADRAAVQRWADEHPLDHLPFTRTSLIAEIAQTLRVQDVSFGASAAGIEGSLSRLEHRLSLFNEYALRQGMWLSEYTALEMRSTPEASALTKTLTSTGALMEEAPGMVEHERRTVLADIERQRLETLNALSRERAIVLQALADEFGRTLEAMNAQRVLAMQDVDSLRLRATADAVKVVDHVMLRVAQLAGALVVLGALALFAVRRGMRT
jgi:hypothetical protein